MPELDVRLADERADLIDGIEQPPLDRIRDRAAARRRRRRDLGRGGGALAVLAIAGVLVTSATHPGTDPTGTETGSPTVGPVYRAAGITVNGLTGGGIREIPGTISDVQFTDPEHGYLLTTCPAGQPCRPSVARTGDGGLSWAVTELPDAVPRSPGQRLLAAPDGALLLPGDPAYTSPDQGRSWYPVEPTPGGLPASAGPDDRLLLGAGPGACAGTVEVWRPGAARTGRATNQPRLGVCWVAPAPATDGGWWAGGISDGQAALAVTRDRGGSWQLVPLDAPAAAVTSVEVADLGSHVYAAVLGPDRSIVALFHSADGGRTFTRTRPGPAGAGASVPQALAGAMVPLVDGRLLVAGTDRRWYVSADDGRTFIRAEGTLPAVGGLARTPAGYVAYDLFGGGWAAYSTDGTTWHKLQIN